MSRLVIAGKPSATLPRAAFASMKDEILGKDYDLTLSIVSPKHIQKLNLQYRNINTPTDILSFPISETEGEIYLCLSESRKEAEKFDRSFNNFLKFLFIHGCVHLKGYDHGGTMENIEITIRQKFGV